MVRGMLERVLGPSLARSWLALPPEELGVRVIQSDDCVGALAASPRIGATGNVDPFLASVNELRLKYEALVPPPSPLIGQAVRRPVDLLAVSELPLHITPIEPVPVEPGDPARPHAHYWSARLQDRARIQDTDLVGPPRLSGAVELDHATWPQVATVGTLACAAASPCEDKITRRIRALLAAATPPTPPPAH